MRERPTFDDKRDIDTGHDGCKGGKAGGVWGCVRANACVNATFSLMISTEHRYQLPPISYMPHIINDITFFIPPLTVRDESPKRAVWVQRAV